MSNLHISASAQVDLQEIWNYIYDRSERFADQMINKITDQFDVLQEFPQMGRSREELEIGIRSFAVESYIIFYRLIDEGIEIARVIHGARDIGNFLR